MSWVKLDDGFIMHRKVMEISNDALALYIASLTHCAKNLTDGLVTPRAARQLAALRGVDTTAAGELLAVGLWEEVGADFKVHDYLDYNPSKEEAEQLKEERAEAGKVGGIRSGESRRSKAEAKREANALAKVKQNGSKTEAVPVPVPVPVSVSVPHNADSPNGESDALKRVERKPVQDVVREAQLELNQPGTNKCAIVHRVACTLYGRSPNHGYIGTAATRVGGYGVLVDLLAANVNKANGCPVAYAEQVWKNRNRSNGGRAGPTRLEPHTLRSNVKCAKCKQSMREYVYETRDKRIPWCYECDGEGPIDDKPG